MASLNSRMAAAPPGGHTRVQLNAWPDAPRSLTRLGKAAISVPQDFAASLLCDTLAQFGRAHRTAKVKAGIERHDMLAECMQAGVLDVALWIARRWGTDAN